MPCRLLHARLRPPPGQRLLLLDGAEDDGQADALQQVPTDSFHYNPRIQILRDTSIGAELVNFGNFLRDKL